MCFHTKHDYTYHGYFAARRWSRENGAYLGTTTVLSTNRQKKNKNARAIDRPKEKKGSGVYACRRRETFRASRCNRPRAIGALRVLRMGHINPQNKDRSCGYQVIFLHSFAFFYTSLVIVNMSLLLIVTTQKVTMNTSHGRRAA